MVCMCMTNRQTGSKIERKEKGKEIKTLFNMTEMKEYSGYIDRYVDRMRCACGRGGVSGYI